MILLENTWHNLIGRMDDEVNNVQSEPQEKNPGVMMMTR